MTISSIGSEAAALDIILGQLPEVEGGLSCQPSLLSTLCRLATPCRSLLHNAIANTANTGKVSQVGTITTHLAVESSSDCGGRILCPRSLRGGLLRSEELAYRISAFGRT
jgi:hypothetical protein